MIRLLFICHGNICRSPMAEFVMKDLADKAGLSKCFYIDSAAVTTEELGNPVYPPARHILREHGIDCTGKRARLMTRADYENFDLIIGMDADNLRRMRRLIGDDSEDKFHLLLDYTPHPRDVADPWWTDDFDTTWNDILTGCTALLEHLT